MPLLKRKAFEKSTVSEYLRDDDEVFHCEITDEIFKDYEEYCERIILVNSMVWTCEMTGKNNLTYSEALESEKAARRSLKDFPMELRIPILYLATKTKRSSFAEMSEDLFNFVRERFFVGETVEACLEGDNWREAHVLSVTAQKQHPDSKSMLPASAYCYEVEQFDEDPAAAGQIGIAPYDRIRRRKGIYTRDKNRLFLKQFVAPGNVIGIKQSAIEKYNIAKVNFDQIFTGNPPDFPSSKKLMKTSMSPPSSSKMPAKPGSASKFNKSLKKPSPDKKGRQESMDKFIKKTEVKPKTPMDPEARKSAQELAEKMRRAEDQMRQRKEEEKAKKKEKNARLMAYMKEWQKVKDDQELEDHKIIPKGTLVEVEGIPHKHFGDFLSVLEFVHNFSELLKVRDVFHNDLDMETFRKSLTSKEHAWMFSELVQMLLSTIFSLQEDEAEEYNESKGIQESTEVAQTDSVDTMRAIELATKAAKWTQTYLGTPLSKLPLDPTTVSEVLRLHLLSSGGAAGSRCAAWRHHQRGGYSSADDPALRLRTARPAALRRLRERHLADLPLDDKFEILQCLMNQIMSYATVRDQIEEKLEEYKNLKQALRTLQINERKREPQLSAARIELKKESAQKKEELKLTGDKARAADEELNEAIEKLKKESELKRVEYEKKLKEMQAQLFDYTTYVGTDRAFRRYWLTRRVAGLFVEAGAEPRGPCRNKPLPPPPAPRDDVMSYVTELFQERDKERQKEQAGSDKENESAANSRGSSPKKPLANLNGLSQKLNSSDAVTQHCCDLLLCTANIDTCYVHGKDEYRPQWWVYNTEEQIQALIESLNKRGVRESELRQTLELDRTNIVDYVKKCPLHLLTPNAQPPQHVPSLRQKKVQPSLNVPPDCSLSEALELLLRDHILELEEKIFHGCLGALKVKDREAWRGTIILRGYDKQADYLSWGPGKQFRDDYHQPDGHLKLPSDLDQSELDSIAENKYRDPGHWLETPKVNGIKSEPEEDPGAKPDVVRGLACALLQVAQSIHQKYLKRPLGLDEKERKEREARGRALELEALERWEVSLMESRSFAALALHLLALDGSVAWAASVLHASCRVCRRRTDPDNMLLCDGCNKGHHLYCLKPKLTKVPEGDWFCDQCHPKEKTPRKRRKLYTDEEADDTLDDSWEGAAEAVCAVCAACGSGGRLAAACRACAARFHAECAAPRQRLSRRFLCDACSAPDRDSEDSEYNTALVKLKSRKQKASEETTSGSKRGRRPKEHINGTSSRKPKGLTNGVHEERASKKRSREALERARLEPDALAALLRDAMRHRDSWPFHDPVSTDEVPDYLDIIKTPMDFTTIKSKLDEGDYETNEQMIADIALILSNCYTYNEESHPVAKAGIRLEKFINKRCSELNLPTLPNTNADCNGDKDPPKAKRQKLN
ncbi:unnamed protein product [Euphydryas editha]|uniref:Bromodomain adjacent to zinc finger domain protein 1A n=1 Tax=Euphydryas editha TaxID=104508 RepID=A0AAU9U6Y6_EUPED|nr:unnamed protein product [Euphydryas editha]